MRAARGPQHDYFFFFHFFSILVDDPIATYWPGQTLATFQRNILQHCCMMLRHVLNGLVKRTQHIATGWPNVRNMLCPTMLQDVALKCCKRLARPLPT